MKKILISIALILMSVTPIYAADVYGSWATPDKKTHIKISKCGDSSICGLITKSKVKGSKDVENEDPALRDRLIKGIELFKLQNTADPKKWEGKLYNARDGKTYTGVMQMLDDNTIKLEGCVFIFCQGEEWTRI